MTTSPHTLTVLRSAGGTPQAKHHVRLPTGTLTSTKIATETWWRYSTREAATLDELARVLRELADDELAVVIRDDPAPGVDVARPIYRRKAECVDIPRAWAMLDIDDLVAPHLDVVDEPELAAHFIRDELATCAPELEGVAMVVAWSGSCGIRDRSTLKAHVWLMLDTPRSGADLKRWAVALNARAPGGKLVDASIFDRVHLHFNARPACTGFPDPFPGDRRFVQLSGASTATLDVPAHNATRAKRPSGDATLGDVRGFDARLARIGVAGVHNETIAAIGAVVRELGADRAEASRASILARIEARIRETRDQARADHHVAQLDGMFSRIIELQRAHDAEATRAAPTYPPRGVPLDVAMARTAEAVDGFVRIGRDRKARLVADAQERKLAAKLAKASGVAQEEAPPIELPPPPVHAIRVDAGTGKTAAIVARIARDRREGAVEHRLRIGYLVPLHRLGDQLVDDLRAAGVSAQLWRGLMADDPDEPGAKMCRETVLAEAALDLGALDVACRVCPSSASCGYMRQKAREPADVEVMAHNFLFAETRAPGALRSCDAIVVDEGFWAHAIEGAGDGDDEPTKLLLSTLDAEPTELSVMAAVDLAALRAKLKRALLRAIEAGELRREMVLDEGLTLDEIAEAIRLEWQRKPEVKLAEGVPVADLVEQLAALRRESTFAMALPGLWSALRRWLSTGAGVAGAIEPLRELRVGRAGSGPGVRFARRRDVASWAQKKPMLLLDATMPVAIVRELLPRVEVVADIEVSRPAGVRHHQLVEALPVSALVEVDDSGAVRAKTKLRDVADRVELLARQARGQGRDGCDVLVGSTIDVEGALRELLLARGLDVAPPDGATRRHAIELAHFGAVEGSNAFAGVRHVVVVSWPLPPAGAMERQARALTGAVPVGEVGAGTWPMAPAGLSLRDGSGRGVEVPRHPDQLVEAMRWAATEGRMLQLADRARGVRRGPEAPVDVWLLSPLPLPGVPADRLLSWADVAVSRLGLAFSRLGGVLPLRPLDLVRTGLWPSEDAAARHVDRERADNAFRGDTLKGVSVLSVRYRHPGQRAWSSALVDPALPPARIVELLRAATGEPDLIVELGAAAPKVAATTATLTDAALSSTATITPPPDPEAAGRGLDPVEVVVPAAATMLSVLAPVLLTGAAEIRVDATAPGAALDAPAGAGLLVLSEQLRRGIEAHVAVLPPWPVAATPRRTFACSPCSSGRNRTRAPVKDAVPVAPSEIRRQLQARGLRIADLARLAGIARPTLANALAGRYRLGAATQARLLDELLALPPGRAPDLFDPPGA